MIDYTKAREPANFKRMFGKYTGIKDEFSALLTSLYWNITGALLTVSTPSCGGFQHWSLSGRRLLSPQVQCPAQCHENQEGNSYVFPSPPQHFSPPNFFNSISLQKMCSFWSENLSGRIVFLLYTLLFSLCVCICVCEKGTSESYFR